MPVTPGAAGHSFEPRVADRPHDYDAALKESQLGAAVRRRSGSGRGPLMQDSTIGQSVLQSRAGAMSPQSAVMEESANPLEAPLPAVRDELEQTGEVRSELGDSYIDGKPSRVRAQASFGASQQDVEDPLLTDGGVLRLLGQIYGSALPARVM